MTLQVDLAETRRLLERVSQRLDELDRRHIPERGPRQDRTAALAAVQRDSLYLAHLLELARVNVLSEYHRIRGGFTDHLPTEEQTP